MCFNPMHTALSESGGVLEVSGVGSMLTLDNWRRACRGISGSSNWHSRNVALVESLAWGLLPAKWPHDDAEFPIGSQQPNHTDEACDKQSNGGE